MNLRVNEVWTNIMINKSVASFQLPVRFKLTGNWKLATDL